MDEDDPVLIALLNRPRDLEIVRSEHWYRIPARRAPEHSIHARYIAFYLTSAFGDDRWSIREYAAVRGHELVRRQDLFPSEPDHPRAGDPYYQLQLGPLIRLPRPITSRRGRRLLFIWTDGRRFCRATELNDLLGRGEADDALWESLKREGIDAERQVTVRDGRSRYRVDFWIPCAKGDLAIVISETPGRLPKNAAWRGLEFSEGQIKSLDECVRRIAWYRKRSG